MRKNFKCKAEVFEINESHIQEFGPRIVDGDDEKSQCPQ